MIFTMIFLAVIVLVGIGMIVSAILWFDEDVPVMLLFGLILIVCGIIGIYSTTTYEPQPTEDDVLAGKAVYQETITITQTGDSIKTYQIVWKEE